MHARHRRVDTLSSGYGVYRSVMQSRQTHADTVLLNYGLLNSRPVSYRGNSSTIGAHSRALHSRVTPQLHECCYSAFDRWNKVEANHAGVQGILSKRSHSGTELKKKRDHAKANYRSRATHVETSIRTCPTRAQRNNGTTHHQRHKTK